ncbi:hypothetical protein [Ottowia sp.]|uniref:hypothetical protein n=1 Tax=Ottowia sp. TaxID=1898956 RepID=UPI0039E297DD
MPPMNASRVLLFVLSCLLVVGVLYATLKPVGPAPDQRAPAAAAPPDTANPAAVTRH